MSGRLPTWALAAIISSTIVICATSGSRVLHAQASQNRQPLQAGSQVSGRVMGSEGQPVPGASVRLQSGSLPEGSRTTLTGEDGRYAFDDLGLGQYMMSVSKAGFLTWMYGRREARASGTAMVLDGSQLHLDVDVQLPRTALISGRVLDDSGAAVPNAIVAPIRVQFSEGQPRLTMMGGRGPTTLATTAKTNARGEYELSGLTPGEYYVSASPVAVTPTNRSPASVGFSVSFHPGTPDITLARRIQVTLASIIDDVDIVVQPARLASVSGFVVDAGGLPVTRGGITVSLRGGVAGFKTAPILRDGTFTFDGLPPGEYVLRASPLRSSPDSGQPNVSIAVVRLDAVDLTGIRLAPVHPVTIHGRISLSGLSSTNRLEPLDVRVYARPLDRQAQAGLGSMSSRVRNDWSFSLTVPPGPVVLRVDVPASAARWRLERVYVQGAEVTDSGLDVLQDLHGVEVVLTDHVQLVSGRVRDATGRWLREYAVVLFPQDPTRWSALLNRYVAVGRPNSRGVFEIASLPPGRYYAAALPRLASNAWQDPAFLEALSVRATTLVSLAAGEQRTLELDLVTIP